MRQNILQHFNVKVIPSVSLEWDHRTLTADLRKITDKCSSLPTGTSKNMEDKRQ